MGKGELMKKILVVIGLILILAGIYVYASHGGFHFNFEPLISESEIVAFTIQDANYIDQNFQNLLVLEKIIDIQAPRSCFSTSKCVEDKRGMETWRASIKYGIPNTSFNQTQPFTLDLPKGTRQIDVEIALRAEGTRLFNSLKAISPPVFLEDRNNSLINDEYDYNSDQWSRR